MTVNLYDTMRCPSCFRCEACGTNVGLLTPWAVRINRGVMCLTLCPGCLQRVTRDVAVPVTDPTAEKFVAQHCDHLEINRHQMGLLLVEEDRQAALRADPLANGPTSRNRVAPEAR